MNITQRAKKIKLLLTDVDGVLTDGKMYFLPGPDGKLVDFNGFNAVDGIGLLLVRSFGITTGMITGRVSPSAEKRAQMLSMKYVYQGFLSKYEPFLDILKHCKLKPHQVAYMGDDWTDIPILKKVGLACAPNSARPEVKKAAHYVTKRDGGDGAMRELCDLILRSQGNWKKIMTQVETADWKPLAREKVIIVKNRR
jgi:YrbI family 3-deoxy-D-manno-octulosonate 8-phosphate phosphatase